VARLESAPVELVCPAGGLPALKAAVDHGADWVYAGLRDDTNARNFPGLNFDDAALGEGIAYAHARSRKVVLAVNTYPQAASWPRWTAAIDRAVALGADAVIIADAGLMRYASRSHPRLELHLSVQGSATSYEAINFFHEHFGVRRAVLPRVLSLAQVERVARRTPAGLESRLNGVLIDRYAGGERAAYPTVCKGRYAVGGETYYAFEEPSSLNTLELLPEFGRIGVRAVKIEGRQRSPAYVAQVTRVWREAIDSLGKHFEVKPEWSTQLARHAEGSQTTLGAFSRPWK